MNVKEGLSSQRRFVFDAVGTLIRPRQSISLVYQRAGQRHGIDLPVEIVKQRFAVARGQQFNESLQQPSSETIERERWQRVVADVFREHRRPSSIFEELWRHYADANQWQLFDDVKGPLTRLLDQEQVLAIASNFDRRLLIICQSIPPLDRITNVFCSSEVGFCKPDPRFYHTIRRALERQGWLPENQPATMIGDDPIRDVRAAISAGWAAAHLNRGAIDFGELVASL